MLNLFARPEQVTVLSLSSRAGSVFDHRIRVNRLASAATLSLRAAVVSLLLAGAASIAIAQESSAGDKAQLAEQTEPLEPANLTELASLEGAEQKENE